MITYKFFKDVYLMRKAQKAWHSTRKGTDYKAMRDYEKTVDAELEEAMTTKVEEQELF